MDHGKKAQVQGITLLRDRLLPNLLKEDEEDILYWSGKELARSFHFSSIEDILDTMEEYAFGSVELIEKKRSKYLFHLSGTVVTERLSENSDAIFHPETGFLAQAIQQVKQDYSEGTYRLLRKEAIIEMTIQTDRKETIEE